MILEVQANAGEVDDRLDARLPQLLGVTCLDVSVNIWIECDLSYQCRIAGG